MRSRDELAEEIALAAISTGSVTDVPRCFDDAYKYADLLIARRVLAPAVEAGGRYVPKVGDVVRDSYHRECVVVPGDPRSSAHGATAYLAPIASPHPRGSVDGYWEYARHLTYLRPATPDERRAAGIDPPAPVATPARSPVPTLTFFDRCPTCKSVDRETRLRCGNINDRYDCVDDWHRGIPALTPESPLVATPASEARPTHVRVTGPTNAKSVTIGKVYKIDRWDNLGDPHITNDRGGDWRLERHDTPDGERGYADLYPTWEPAPAPAATVDEAVDALVKACGVFRRNHASLSPDAFDAAYPSGVHSIWAAMDALARAKGGGA